MSNVNKLISTVGCLVLMHIASHGQNKSPIGQNFLKSLGQKSKNNSPVIAASPIPSQQMIVSVDKTFAIQKENDYSIIQFKEKGKTTVNNFFNLFSKELKISNSDNFNLLKLEKDEIGFTHYRYQQTYNGILVSGGEYLLHEKNGKLISANGNFYSGLSMSISPNIPAPNAIQFAIKSVGAEKYLWDNRDEEAFLKKEKNNIHATYYPQAELIIAPANGVYQTERFRLCYKINISCEKPYNIVDVYIDAQTGTVLNTISKIAHSDVTGSASTLYSGTKTITMDSYGGNYRLRESGRPIQTFNMGYGKSYSNAVDFINPTTSWAAAPTLVSFSIANISQSWWYAIFADVTPDLYLIVKDGSNQVVANTNDITNTFTPVTFNLNIQMVNPPYKVEVWDYDVIGDDFGGSYTISTNPGASNWSGNGNNGSYSVNVQGNPALDAHWAMEKTYDFYLSQLGRNSYDNAGALIKNYVHTDVNFNNAFWNGTAMSYGDGDGIEMNALVSIDVVGHEFTHAVVEKTADLQYQGESGALNESFADIFGTAIEFYGSSSPNWTMAEDFMLTPPFIMRSLSNPNICGQPDTYNGQYWHPSSNSSDHGGVHTNSGVQNFWFYLLCQGGSGTNDPPLNNAYTVTGIGINQAVQIAYRNLRFYLTQNSNYFNSYYGSLQAAEDLYGNPSSQYNAVRAAWYAVGIGSNPTTYCSGTTNLTATSGTFTDGSGAANYNNNARCKWVIAPPGATQITLTFTAFDTELNYDTVFIYNGPDTTGPAVVYTGNTLPPTLQTTSGTGAMCIKFKTDGTVVKPGWSANYSSIGIAPTCSGGTILSSPIGSLSDGSGASTYGNNQLCYWLIAPPCANNVTLSFSAFNTEANYDRVLVFDGNNTNAPLLLDWWGNTIPPNKTSSSGEMLVVFVSDYATVMQGFSASYTSTGTPYCSGTTSVNTSDWGTITDGSGANNYCNNMDCSWLIQPPQATTVTFDFTSIDIESISPDGFTIYDAVEIYDGTNASAPLLGRYAGTTLPPSITTTGGSMYIRFFSDMSVTGAGWAGYYTSTTTNYCTGTTTLTSPSGIFSDGSASNLYGNNADCKWLIQPPGASSITLSFTSFDTEQNYDGVLVYDGADTSATQLGTFTGTSAPPVLTSSGGAMYVWFVSDITIRQNGWDASYNSSTTAIENQDFLQAFSIYPNPSNGVFMLTIEDSVKAVLLTVSDMIGQIVFSKEIKTTSELIDLSNQSNGIYCLQIHSDIGSVSKKITINR